MNNDNTTNLKHWVALDQLDFLEPTGTSFTRGVDGFDETGGDGFAAAASLPPHGEK